MSNHPAVHMFREDFRDGCSLTAFVRHAAAVTIGAEVRLDLTAEDWVKAHKLADELLAFVRKADG